MEKWRFICRLMRWNSRGLFFSLRITELPGSMQVVRNDIQKNYEVKIIWNNTAIMRKLEKSHWKRKQYKIVKTQEKAFISWVWMSFWAIRGNLCGKIILSTAWHRSSTARLKNTGSVCREQCVCQREIKGRCVSIPVRAGIISCRGKPFSDGVSEQDGGRHLRGL